VSIDKFEPITIDDCERVSRIIGPLLDNASLIPGPYHLEVSSPGAERPLRGKEDYERFNGKRVNVRYRTGETESVVEGHLVAVDGAGIAVQSTGQRGRAPVIVHIGWDDFSVILIVNALCAGLSAAHGGGRTRHGLCQAFSPGMVSVKLTPPQALW
jgi:ribosome maturation factor RimP